MANSRSNIYPVQLQGAELNLNKLDAEIKQYSGFNKNNAPFVGGCLSNIFTKDETIEGATSKNTYIAPNGDVYRVTTEGLFKNDTKLIDTSGADFFNVVDLGVNAFPESTVYVYDEETYIYIKDGKYFYHSGEVDHDFLSPYETDINIFAFENIDYQIIKKTVDEVEYNIVGILFQNRGGNYVNDTHCFVNVYKKTAEGTLDSVYDKYLDNTKFLGINFSESPYSFILKCNDNFDIYVLTGTNFTVEGVYNNYYMNFNGTAIVNVTPLNVRFSNGNQNVLAASFYRFSDKYAVRCIKGSEISSSTNIALKCTYSLNGLSLVLDTAYSTANQKVIAKGTEYDRCTIIKPYGIQSCVGYKEGYLYSIDDEITGFAYYDASDSRPVYAFNLGGILNGCVLTNNYLASGLSLPGGFVLVTEWNSVDLDYIFFGENTEEWKENKFVYLWKNINTGKWYKLVKSTPWLKVINNQVIINSNTQFNSIDIARNKKLLFAPAWNNRRPSISRNVSISANAVYMATSINEYNLEDNASLLLNPVLVTGGLSSIEVSQKLQSTEKIIVNIYSGSVAVTYNSSFYMTENPVVRRYKYDSLLELPFPTNTDGNVQYSPSLFATEKGKYGNLVFISEGGTAYKLMTYDNKAVMSYFLSTAVEGLQDFFTIQGQLYGILDNQIYSFSIVNEIANRGDFIVSVEGLQFVGNTPYEALFFSKTNRCLYSFTGANVLNAKQFVDKISEVRNYKYNPATQSIFLITDIGVIVYSLFGIYQIEFLNCQDMYLLNNGVILTDNEGTFKYVKYYKEETTDDYIKENIQLETMFYGMNNQTVTINDCLYMRIFSEEHEEGDLEVSATTLSLEGRMTEKTTFKIKASDWDKVTHTIYLRYQPKEQRGLGISFSINSPFKVASLSVGSQADAILVDKVSKGAINAPQRTSNNTEW